MGEIGDYWREAKEHRRIVKTFGSIAEYHRLNRQQRNDQKLAIEEARQKGSGIYDGPGWMAPKPYICGCGRAFDNIKAQHDHARALKHKPIESPLEDDRDEIPF